MASKYAEDLKRIVGVKDTKGELGTYEPREALGPTRGIGYANSSGGTSAASGGPGAKAPVTPPTDPGKLSPLDKTNPETTLAGEATTEADAEGNLNGAVSADKLLDKTALESTPVPTTTSEGSQVNNKFFVDSITAVDCATGDNVVVGMIDDWTPPPASYYDDGSQATNEWETATTPPVLFGYEDGFYWSSIPVGVTNVDGSTAREAGDGAADAFDAAFPANAPHRIVGIDSETATSVTFEYARFGASNFTHQVNRSACSGVTPACPASPPVETSWPASEPVKYKKSADGTFSTSTYDSNAPVGSNEGVSVVNVCGSDTGNNIAIQAGANGTTLVYQTDTPNGSMTSGTTAAIVGPDKSVIGYTDSAGLSNYTLK